MIARERVRLALEHQEADRVPLDLGATVTTGMHVSVVYQLRQALGLDAPGMPVKVIEPGQMLGEIKPDLMDALGVDTVAVMGLRAAFGFPMAGWKPWSLHNGTPVLVPDGFNIVPERNGDILIYPEGDRSAPPSGRMPKDGWFIDALIRQPPIDEERLNPADNLEEYGPISAEALDHFRREVERLFTATDRALVMNFGGMSFGDVARVPGVGLRHPRGIRDVEEWYVSLLTRPTYIRDVFEGQCAIALNNLAKLFEAVGNRVSVLYVTGADFGAQNGLLVAPDVYRELFMPVHQRVNDWVHCHTTWKTFMHSCGAVIDLMDLFIEAGFDILNPVQCSAAGMDPAILKRRFGSRLTFWGGGVDTQQVLPFGSPEDVRRQVAERIRDLGSGGGFVFNPIHNVQAQTPIANLLALYETVRECGRYPLR
ncbi:MAG: uroporphyrinogen decarboxylase family protein [Verrucomicrobiota bacterium]